MSDSRVQIVFTPSGKRGDFAVDTDVLSAARKLGVDLDSVCGGRGICGRCQVICATGEFSKLNIRSSATSLSDFNEVEAEYQTRRRKDLTGRGRRLACQARMQSDVVIDVPADSQVHRQVIRKEAESLDITLNAAVRIYFVQINKPDMHEPASDLRRLRDALARDWELRNLTFDPHLLPVLQSALRAEDFAVTVAVHENRDVIAVWPGLKSRVLGVAVDIGSTTIAAHLCDLGTGEVLASEGAMNPQIRFGEDLMSRVSYIMMNPGGEQALTEAVRAALNDLLARAARSAGASIEDVLEVTVVGNPVMHHLFLGINPVELGGAPFALATDEATQILAREVGITAHANARIYVLPCIAGHVGADAAGAMLADKPYIREEINLLVDVGTNAEIMLGSRQRMLACSSPTGPAFEGAQLSCGQRAAPGAIERVRIDRDTLAPRFKIIGHDEWLEGDGFVPGKRQAGITGICGSGVIEAVAELYLAGIINADGLFIESVANTCERVFAEGRTWSYRLYDGDVEVKLTQNDIRQIQLAKSALYAGIRLLMDHLGVDHVDRIRLAGAFGNHIDVKYAMVLGLIPDCPLSQVTSAGNAAGTGARMALLDSDARREIEQMVLRVEKIETAVEPRFQEHFVEAMAIPHKTHAFPNLASQVHLPALQDNQVSRRPRGRRGRRAASA